MILNNVNLLNEIFFYCFRYIKLKERDRFILLKKISQNNNSNNSKKIKLIIETNYEKNYFITNHYSLFLVVFSG